MVLCLGGNPLQGISGDEPHDFTPRRLAQYAALMHTPLHAVLRGAVGVVLGLSSNQTTNHNLLAALFSLTALQLVVVVLVRPYINTSRLVLEGFCALVEAVFAARLLSDAHSQPDARSGQLLVATLSLVVLAQCSLQLTWLCTSFRRSHRIALRRCLQRVKTALSFI